MATPLTAQIGRPERVDLGAALIGGMQNYQSMQGQKLQNQAMQQDVSQGDFAMNLRNLQIMNSLAKKAKTIPLEQRPMFRDQQMQLMQSIGINPSQMAQAPLDDASLDQWIGQSDAVLASVMPKNQAQQQFGAQETLKDENGNLFFATSRRDPSTGQVVGAVAAVDGSNTKPVGQLSVAGGYGLTATERVGQLAAESGAKKQAEQDVMLATEPKIQEEIERRSISAKFAETARADAIKSGKKYDALMLGFEEAKNLIPMSTGSSFGSIRNIAGKTIGFTTEASQNTRRLRALSAWLVTQVPKPGGSVSDADLAQFKMAVGEIDDNIPAEDRLAALDTAMKMLNMWKSDLQPDEAIGSQPSEENTVDWNSLP